MTTLEKLQALYLERKETSKRAKEESDKYWRDRKRWMRGDDREAYEEAVRADARVAKRIQRLESKARYEFVGELDEPTYITWKKYGWRHIATFEKRIDLGDNWPGYDRLEGVALCGNKYWSVVEKESDNEKYYEYDLRNTERPLCGNCRKAWKKATGKELPR